MATVFITFFLITQFYVFKMDDDSTERLRNISQREKRWSMNSQRLEEIVAELMKPISDVRRSFDTDLSALLEEYLTEAGLHALDAEEDGVSTVIPNFAELALLLQQSASIYSRKVDFLYQHVLNVSDSLQQSTQEARPEGAAEAQGASARRKRRASVATHGFAPLALEAGAGRRDAPLRPAPTLPRLYAELAPRAPGPGDAPLRDYAGEPVGLLPDFHVFWRLQDGYLVELSGTPTQAARLAALSQSEELSAAAAGAPPASGTSAPPACSPATLACSPATPVCNLAPASRSPSPLAGSPPPDATSTPLPPDKRDRKRRSDVRAEDVLDGTVTLRISKETRRRLRAEREFGVPRAWLRRVLRSRRALVLAARRQLPPEPPEEPAAFRGFEDSAPAHLGGFAGWSRSEGAQATRLAGARRPDDSDDDGFFEQSSLGESEGSRADECCAPAAWGAWREAVVARAAAAEARGRDVRRAAAALLAAADRPPPPPPFRELLARTAHHPADVSELFLATLFLANAGNVEIIPGAPLTVDSFAVRFVSADRRSYGAALAEPPQRPQR